MQQSRSSVYAMGVCAAQRRREYVVSAVGSGMGVVWVWYGRANARRSSAATEGGRRLL
ncbi:uncharacterized protein MYCFIDRAFT_171803 [Pseudocercospora fijiensis CIRAD86]|uniref:Uncharacterized protein n=1 Tax=Pseudocercospora fijiensis (strain CIRAD86) TaxID=383855 RepID=M3B9M6_PSEFD|nr:uncharacterized protein MYCFIDRAFT_171803 [Pseudocercospora fijiensis CIRAD86]EME85963.1 hypothetical protein MYCFIDRAFT_171803 [Pseudocercospora fijiensis CIRAD86]